jgi:excisionase family DNA binding protein
VTASSAVVAHLERAVEMHRRWCRDQRIRVPAELDALLEVLRSCQEPSSAPPRLGPGDDAGVPLAYPYDEAGRLLAVSSSTITRMVADGRLRAVTIGRARRIPRTELERLLEEGPTL